MNATRKTNSVVAHSYDAASGILTFTVLGAGSFTFDASRCTDEVEVAATLHGYVQKISDKAAIGRDPQTGRSATPQQKFAAMKSEADRLQSGGAWTSRAAGKPTLDRASLFAAVAAVRGLSAEVVAQRWQDKPDEVLRTVLTHKDVAAEYARLTASGQADESLFEGLA